MALDVSVVLVRTLYQRNIGSVSRAMTNMGLRRLILINPQCAIDYEAQKSAARGQYPLQNRIEYKTWEDFYIRERDGIRVAFTARDGRSRQVFELEEFLKILKNSEPYKNSHNIKHSLPIYLIFGPEDAGLTDEDISKSHYSTYIKTFGDNLSFNLAHAVLLSLYLFRNFFVDEVFYDGSEELSSTRSISSKSKDFRPTSKPIFYTENLIREWIEVLGFNLSHRKVSAFTVMKRLILHSLPTEKEMRILEVVLRQNIRKLKSYRDNV